VEREKNMIAINQILKSLSTTGTNSTKL